MPEQRENKNQRSKRSISNSERGGRTVSPQGILALSTLDQAAVFEKIRLFDTFTQANDREQHKVGNCSVQDWRNRLKKEESLTLSQKANDKRLSQRFPIETNATLATLSPDFVLLF